jgi:cold shock CspA family protein
MDELIIGKVLWFNKAKGYGEIYGENGITYFFTYKSLISNEKIKIIEKGTFVYFSSTLEIHLNRPIASSVKEATKKKAISLHSHFRDIEL